MSTSTYFLIGLAIVAAFQIIAILLKDASGTCIVCGGSGWNRYTGDKCSACMGTGKKKKF